MARIIVETTFDPTSNLAMQSLPIYLMPCFRDRSIRWLRTLRSLDHCRTICELEAADAESVRASYRMAGLPFDRIWTAELQED